MKEKNERWTPAQGFFGNENDRAGSAEKKRLEIICGKYLQENGPEADVVISSHIRLARNIRGNLFPSLASNLQRKQILQLFRDILQKEKTHFSRFQLLELDSIKSAYKQALLEKDLITPLMVRENNSSALCIREDEVVGIMVNEEDHVRIQCMLPGLQLEQAWQEVSLLDDFLDHQAHFAFHTELGYLTACPTTVGTGLRASVMLHLPALVITRQISRILSALNQVGLIVQGIYGESTDYPGNCFQVSNQVTLGQAEDEIRHNLYGVTRELINQEKKAREHLLNEGRERLGDRSSRALGVMRYARVLGAQEAMQLISDLRLGLNLGLVRNIDANRLNQLSVLIQPGCLQYLKDRALSAYEQDLERAALVQKILDC